MKEQTVNKLRRSSNAVKQHLTTTEDGLECFNGTGAVAMLGLLIVLLIAFGWLLGGL